MTKYSYTNVWSGGRGSMESHHACQAGISGISTCEAGFDEAYQEDLRQRISKRMREQKDSKSVSITQKNLRRRQAQQARESRIQSDAKIIYEKLAKEREQETLITEGDNTLLDDAIAKERRRKRRTQSNRPDESGEINLYEERILKLKVR